MISFNFTSSGSIRLSSCFSSFVFIFLVSSSIKGSSFIFFAWIVNMGGSVNIEFFFCSISLSWFIGGLLSSFFDWSSITGFLSSMIGWFCILSLLLSLSSIGLTSSSFFFSMFWSFCFGSFWMLLLFCISVSVLLSLGTLYFVFLSQMAF